MALPMSIALPPPMAITQSQPFSRAKSAPSSTSEAGGSDLTSGAAQAAAVYEHGLLVAGGADDLADVGDAAGGGENFYILNESISQHSFSLGKEPVTRADSSL